MRETRHVSMPGNFAWHSGPSLTKFQATLTKSELGDVVGVVEIVEPPQLTAVEVRMVGEVQVEVQLQVKV